MQDVIWNEKGHLIQKQMHHESSNPNHNTLSPEEEAFLKESIEYKPSYKLPSKHDADSGRLLDDNLPKFDESWPDSERPSSLSLPETDDISSPLFEQIKKSTKSRSSISSTLSSLPRNSSPVLSFKEKLSFDDFLQPALMGLGQTSGSRADRMTKGPAANKQATLNTEDEAKSTLSKYIDRFRHGVPLSRDDRHKENCTSVRDFWWLKQSDASTSPSPRNDRDTNRHLEMYKKMSHDTYDQHDRLTAPLTTNKLDASRLAEISAIPVNPWTAVDTETKLLQDKADEILEKSASTILSSEPIVSTNGLGSSLDVTSISEEPYHPTFLQNRYQRDLFPHEIIKKHSKPEDDILYQWRLRRKMEEAKQTLTAEASNTIQVKQCDIDSKLVEFRQRLAGGTIKSDHQRTAPVSNFTPAPERLKDQLKTNVHHLHLSVEDPSVVTSACSVPEDSSSPNNRTTQISVPRPEDSSSPNNRTTSYKVDRDSSITPVMGENVCHEPQHEDSIAMKEQYPDDSFNDKSSDKCCQLKSRAVRSPDSDSSFEEVKSQHLRNLNSYNEKGGEKRCRPSEIEEIPERDLSHCPTKKHLLGKAGGCKENKSKRCRNVEATESLTEVSDCDHLDSDNYQQPTKDENTSRQQAQPSGDQCYGLRPVLSRDEIQKRETLDPDLDIKHHRPHHAHQKRKPSKASLRKHELNNTEEMSSSMYQSSPQPLNSAIGQAVQQHLLASCLSLTDSDISVHTSGEEDQTPVRPVSRRSPHEEASSKLSKIHIGDEVISLSDSDEFGDDELLCDLRQRRQLHLEKLTQLDIVLHEIKQNQ